MEDDVVYDLALDQRCGRLGGAAHDSCAYGKEQVLAVLAEVGEEETDPADLLAAAGKPAQDSDGTAGPAGSAIAAWASAHLLSSAAESKPRVRSTAAGSGVRASRPSRSLAMAASAAAMAARPLAVMLRDVARWSPVTADRVS